MKFLLTLIMCSGISGVGCMPPYVTDQKYKDLWYKKVKELSNGLNNTKRRDVQSRTGHKRDDGKYEVIHGSRKFI